MTRWKNPIKPVPGTEEYLKKLDEFISKNPLSNIEKFENFTMFTPPWGIMRFLVRNELFKKIIEVEGEIIEAGVYHGGGLMSWAQLSSIYEPYNHKRKVIGFDTFSGFKKISQKDGKEDSAYKKEGYWSSDSYNDLLYCSNLFDMTRPMGQIPKVELVKGDIMKTAKQFLKDNPQLIISLLYLDVDLYKPTKEMLKVFLTRMNKGSIIVFDQINTRVFPGETLAVEEIIGIKNLEIKRFPFTSITYAIIK